MDKVIRREIRLDEGDTFNSKLLKRSYERLTNLNFFETVDLQPKPKPEEKLLDIDVKVKEKPTGMLSVGGGYSSVDKFLATADVTQANLFGTGRLIKLKGNLAAEAQRIALDTGTPGFLIKNSCLEPIFIKRQGNIRHLTEKRPGLMCCWAKSLSEYWKTDVTYNFESVTIHNISSNASARIKDQEGKK